MKELQKLKYDNHKYRAKLDSHQVKMTEAIDANARLIDSKHTLLLEYEDL